MYNRVIPWLIGAGTVVAGLGCKPKLDHSDTLEVSDEYTPVDAMAAIETQKIADACEGARDGFFRGRGRGDEVEFLWQAPAPVTGETGNPEFHEKARFDGKQWILSSRIHREFDGRECASAKTFTTPALITALGCSNQAPTAQDFCSNDAGTDPVAQPKEGTTKGFGLTEATGKWTWEDCNDPSYSYHLVARTGGVMNCQGKIDTLYSWGPLEKIDWLKTQNWGGRLTWNNGRSQIFTIQSAFASHGYGQAAIRFKLKQNVKWRWFDHHTAYQACDFLSAAELENTVVVRYLTPPPGRTGVEMILCSLGPVASWSSGTEEHAREIERDLAWVESHSHKEYELYVKQNGVDEVFPTGLDGKRFDRAELIKKIESHRARGGRVINSPTVSSQPEAEHFKTAWTNYIQLNGDPAKTPEVAVEPVTPPAPPVVVNRGPVNTNLQNLTGRFVAASGSQFWADNGQWEAKWFNTPTRFKIDCTVIQPGQATCVAQDPWRTTVTFQWAGPNQINILRNGYAWTGFARRD